MLVLALLFASTFILLNATGVITLERIQHSLDLAKEVSPLLTGAVVTILLFADLFVAMPTLTIMLLSGFFLGPAIGAGYSIAGLVLAGFVGYGLSHRYGERLLNVLIRENKERCHAVHSFRQHGIMTILLSRAVPILPEVSVCMAGMTKMPLGTFSLAWLASTVPYAVIAAYAGSISSVANPQPAIFTAIGLTTFFWLAWYVFNKNTKTKSSKHPISLE